MTQPLGRTGLVSALSLWLGLTLAITPAGAAASPTSPTKDSLPEVSRDTAPVDHIPTSLTFAFDGPADSELLAEQTDDVEIILDEPTADTADQFIFLSDPDTDKKTGPAGLTVERSQDSRPSILFHLHPPGLDGGRALTAPGALAGPIDDGSPGNSLMTGTRLTFSYGADPQSANSGLGVSLGSSFLITPDSPFSPLFDGSGYDSLTRQAYNLSLDVAYAGFSLGASYSRDKSLTALNLQGFDVGLGYAGRSWFTDIRFAQYRRDRELLFSANAGEYMAQQYFNSIYAVQVGAGYSLKPNIHFTGRFTYYTYGQTGEQDPLSDTQIFLLGTNVNF